MCLRKQWKVSQVLGPIWKSWLQLCPGLGVVVLWQVKWCKEDFYLPLTLSLTLSKKYISLEKKEKELKSFATEEAPVAPVFLPYGRLALQLPIVLWPALRRAPLCSPESQQLAVQSFSTLLLL